MTGTNEKRWPPKDPSGKSDPDGTNGDKMEAGTASALKSADISLRFYSPLSDAFTRLQAGLSKVKGVEKVDADAGNTIKVTFTGTYDGLRGLEAAAAGTGIPAIVVSHARILISLKPQKEADAKTLKDDLNRVAGVKSVNIVGAMVEIYANMDELIYESIKEAATGCNFEIKLASHEWVTVTLSAGEASAMEKDLSGTRGVLVLHTGTDKVEMWTVKKIGDATFKKVAEKSGVTIGEISRS